MLNYIQKSAYDVNGKQTEVAELYKNFLIKISARNNAMTLIEYTVTPSDSPRSVADAIYKNPEYDWLVLLAAGIVDERSEWPLTYDDLVEVCQKKYDNIYDVHHYESTIGDIIDHRQTYLYKNNIEPVPVTVIPVTNLDYESAINEARKTISVYNPRLIEELASAIEESLKSRV